MLKFWDTASNILQPDGTTATPEEFISMFPFAGVNPTVLTMSGEIVMACDDLYTLERVYGLDLGGMSDNEKLAAIEDAIRQTRTPASADEVIERTLQEAIDILKGVAE